jgi:hypothetical protein
MGVTLRYARSRGTDSLSVLLNPKSRFLTALQFGSHVPETVVVYDQPTPIPMCIQPFQASAIVVFGPASMIRRLKLHDGGSNEVQGAIGAP